MIIDKLELDKVDNFAKMVTPRITKLEEDIQIKFNYTIDENIEDNLQNIKDELIEGTIKDYLIATGEVRVPPPGLWDRRCETKNLMTQRVGGLVWTVDRYILLSRMTHKGSGGYIYIYIYI